MSIETLSTITFLIMEVDKYRKLAYTDELTGLPNERAIREAVEDKPGGAWVVADLDGFKAYQDANGGHEEGDKVLRAFADFLRSNTRSCGGDRNHDIIAARLHGDEFAVYVTGRDPLNGANRIAMRIMSDWSYGPVTASAGTGLTEKDADAMVYTIKNGLSLSDKV